MRTVNKQVKPAASLSIDLDNAWAYLRAAGNRDWETAATYLPSVIPHIVEQLQQNDLPLTVFVVGRDLEKPSDVEAIKGFHALKGIEFANHSYHHEPWLHTYDQPALAAEVERTEQAIMEQLGTQPVGFRGPGFSGSTTLWQLLAERGYLYDSSLFPTSMAPIARMYFMMKTGRQGDPRLRELYGGWRAVLQPNKPFVRLLSQRRLIEQPVTVMPFLRTPIHFSYLLFLAQLNRPAANLYWRSVLWACRLTKVAPHLLLHPPDFLGGDEEQRLNHMPGMKLSGRVKRGLLTGYLKQFAERFEVTTLVEQVQQVSLREYNPAQITRTTAESLP